VHCSISWSPPALLPAVPGRFNASPAWMIDDWMTVAVPVQLIQFLTKTVSFSQQASYTQFKSSAEFSDRHASTDNPNTF
jgi:hypothetical protein